MMIYFLGYLNVRMKPETDIRTSPKPEQFPPPPTFLDGKGRMKTAKFEIFRPIE